MSAILGVFHRDGRPVDDALVARLLEPMGGMGARTAVTRPAPGACLAVRRHPWEDAPGRAGPAEVVSRGDVAVACDATLYYRHDLRRRLAARHVATGGPTPADHIAAAWDAWGDGCPERLEGDYAFVVYDRRAGRVFCARDLSGRRPLFYADLGDTLVVASRVAAILAHPGCPARLNLAVVGATAADMSWSIGSDTVYSAVRVVPMAGTLDWRGGTVRLGRHWRPEDAGGVSEVPFERAAEELREALATAVEERVDPGGTTAVWMSGGRDSTAVFAAGQRRLRETGGPGELLPVSISYPPGDWGREDEAIEAVAAFWEAPVHWLDIADIPMFANDEARAATRDEPTTSPYELWNLALADGTRACGAHVGLDGNGGDQLFTGTDVYLSDLLVGGHWLTLLRSLWDRRRVGLRHLVRAALAPLSLPTVDLGRRRARPAHYLENEAPAWLRRDFMARQQLVERERAHLPAEGPYPRTVAEMRWSLGLPVVGYSQGLFQPAFLERGIEMRSPLLDRRVVTLALRRPPFERFVGVEKKTLLRRAMRGLLPGWVLRERPLRTGTTLTWSTRSMRAHLVPLYERIATSALHLVRLGVVDGAALALAVARYAGGDDAPRIDLYHTLQTELWLRAHAHAA